MEHSKVLKQVAFITCFVVLNAVITALMFIYDRYYWYLIFSSLGNLYRLLFILVIAYKYIQRFVRYVFKKQDEPHTSTDPQTVVTVIPCYTENKEELMRNVVSIQKNQEHARQGLQGTKFVNVFIVDGEVVGKGNSQPTYQILQDILGYEFYTDAYVHYDSWKGRSIGVRMANVSNVYGDYIVICKQENVGKKDSLILIRELLRSFNEKDSESMTSCELLFAQLIRQFDVDKVSLLIGVDADTRFDDSFTTNICTSANEDNDVLGVSGYVIPDLSVTTRWNFLFFYQYFEYHLQQGLTRLGQSYFNKVTCLPGCAQVWKVDSRTMEAPLEEFKKYKNENSIIQSIRALLGEDRRYTGLVLYNNPTGKTTLNLSAKAYTSVPVKWNVFISQRRRWFLSSQVNNIRDTLSPQLPLIIRFVAFTQLWNAMFIVVNMAAVIKLILALRHPSIATLVAFSIFLFIFVYKFILCIVKSTGVFDFLYLLSSAIAYSFVAPFINLFIMFKALLTMNDLNWGATQKVAPQLEMSQITVEQVAVSV